jgi:hypothetical protein
MMLFQEKLQIGVCTNFLIKVNGPVNIPQIRKAATLVPDIADIVGNNQNNNPSKNRIGSFDDY